MNKVKGILAHALLVLFMLHHISCSYFYHTHTYSWGTVVHSHLFSDSENELLHTHSAAQLLLIAQLNHAPQEATTALVVPLLIAMLVAVLSVKVVIRTLTPYQHTYTGLSPPIFC